jgi:hypothetical protein
VGIKFPSAAWTSAFKDAINANDAYAKAGKEWTHGKVAYVVKARPELGIEKDTAMVLDLHAGKCREASMVDAAQAQSSDFVIVAEYERVDVACHPRSSEKRGGYPSDDDSRDVFLRQPAHHVRQSTSEALQAGGGRHRSSERRRSVAHSSRSRSSSSSAADHSKSDADLARASS